MESPAASTPRQRQFPCKDCGANLVFAPGTNALTCPYCGAANEIESADAIVEELDFHHHLSELAGQEATEERVTVRCNTCGAETTLAANRTADRCPFCGSGIVAQAVCRKLIKPRSLLPFRITHTEAANAFRQWIASLWFAPSELKNRADREQINGVYIPCWTYDAQTTSHYTGQRGEDYWVTESYTAYENGKHVTRTRQVKHTNWYPASGIVDVPFDDLLVLASRSLPSGYAEKLEPWDLGQLTPYRDEYLSGFVAESYQVDLAQGFDIAKGMMEPAIHSAIRRDIGGDQQRIHSVDTRYSDVTFKHALLPIWISAYRYQDKVYRFLINARTGEVQGERPWSWVKITLAVLAGLLIALIVLMISSGGRF